MITPIEIRQQTFRRSLRGYDPDEVRAFLQSLSDEWENQLETYGKLREEFMQLQANYNSLKELEHMLHKTLLQAEQSSKTTMENARQKAELKVQEAEGKARDIVRRGIDERNRLEGEILDLTARREELILQLEGFLQAQSDRLKAFERKELPPRNNNPRPNGTWESKEKDLFGQEEALNGSSNGSSDGGLYDDIVNEL